MIARPARTVPGRAAELRELTDPPHADVVARDEPGGQLASADGPQTLFLSASDSIVLVEREVGDQAFQAIVFVLKLAAFRMRAIEDRLNRCPTFLRAPGIRV